MVLEESLRVIYRTARIYIPPLVTKDGVTMFSQSRVYPSTFTNLARAACQRNTSVRTASEAGDGTTMQLFWQMLFTGLQEPICNNNPTVPGIQVIKTINKILKNTLLPAIDRLRITCDFSTEEGKKLLAGVAAISGNGDKELAEAVMQCFDICGDEGNVTIIESTGPTGYEVERKSKGIQ